MTAVDPELLRRGGLSLDVDGPRATISLARPDVRNAQTPLTWKALRSIGESLPDEVRVVVVRGAGRAFSAGLDRRLFPAGGADGSPGGTGSGGVESNGVGGVEGNGVESNGVGGVGDLADLADEEADAAVAGFQAGFSWLRDPARLTVAAVQGHAIGAGFQLALACDLRVVADDVQLCMAETSLGLVPDLGGTYLLVHTVGYARAVEICLSGRRIGAEEAVSTGLALRAVPVTELDAAVDDLVTSLLGPPPQAATETLGLLAGVAEGADPATSLAAERAAQLRRLRSMAAGQR